MNNADNELTLVERSAMPLCDDDDDDDNPFSVAPPEEDCVSGIVGAAIAAVVGSFDEVAEVEYVEAVDAGGTGKPVDVVRECDGNANDPVPEGANGTAIGRAVDREKPVSKGEGVDICCREGDS